MTERQVLQNSIFIRRRDDRRFPKATSALGTLRLQQVAATRFMAEDFAAGSDLKPLGRGFFRFNAFRATHICSAFF